jgi:hypothetical protein
MIGVARIVTAARARIPALITLVCLSPAAGCQPAPEELVIVAASAQPALPRGPAAGAFAPARAPQPTALTLETPSGVCAARGSNLCSLDTVLAALAADVTSVDRRAPVRLSGWAADEQGVPPTLVLELAADKRYYAPAAHGVKRPDVAAARQTPAFEASGYDVMASLAAVEAGEYALHVVQITASGDVLRCATGRRLRVR